MYDYTFDGERGNADSTKPRSRMKPRSRIKPNEAEKPN